MLSYKNNIRCTKTTGSADYVLVSENIFTAKVNKPFSGFVAIVGNKIAAVAPKSEIQKWVNADTVVYNLGDRFVTPGFIDNHTFFTGNVLTGIGVDLSKADSKEEVLELIKNYATTLPEGSTIYGHSWNPYNCGDDNPGAEALDKLFPDRPVVIFTFSRDNCWLNSCAMVKYKFYRSALNFEVMWRMFKEYLNENDFIIEEYKKFMKTLNSRGITSIKDVGFDDFYGFLPILSKLETDKELTLRVNFVSQPVSESINFDYGVEVRAKYHSDFLRFQGYNLMTDGTIDSFKGDLIEPYANRPDIHVIKPIDYEKIEKILLKGDSYGFKFGLHAQGDRAIRKSLDIFEKCRKINGERDSRHNITDLEMANPQDIERMGKLKVIAEVYAQLITYYGTSVLSISNTFVGPERVKNYWNHRKMVDSGVVVSFATDLPLLIPDIPDSIYGVVGKLFPNGEGPFNPENSLTIAEALKAWTINGQYNNFADDKLGTIEKGKYADIAVLDKNLFEVPMASIRDVKVCMTIFDGRIVYDTINK